VDQEIGSVRAWRVRTPVPVSTIGATHRLDVHANLRTFRGVIGFVPQDDTIHADLPLQHTLHYAARLRLPSSTPLTPKSTTGL